MSTTTKRMVSLPIENWLRDEVAPTFDRMQTDPSRAIPAAEVFAALRTRHAEGLKTPKRAT